jgi:hypothetical protein
MEYQSLWLPKAGNSAEEYEDASAADPARGVFAVADGATESSFAAQWARGLVEGFVRHPIRRLGDWLGWLPPLQQAWDREVGQEELPWFAESKRELGAFATFLGLVLDAERGRWRAVAVGDCCLFLVRDGGLRLAFPIRQSSAFGNSPALVNSRQPPADLLGRRKLRARNGRWHPGDQFWLMTDALAHWFLRQHEAGAFPWQTLAPLVGDPTGKPFAGWMSQARKNRDIRNDDVTLLMIRP